MRISLIGTLGAAAASFTDPVGLLFGAIAAWQGWRQRHILYLVALAVIFSTLKLAVLYSWWTEGGGIGVSWQQMFVRMALADAVFIAFNYALGLLARKALDLLTPTNRRP